MEALQTAVNASMRESVSDNIIMISAAVKEEILEEKQVQRNTRTGVDNQREGARAQRCLPA